MFRVWPLNVLIRAKCTQYLARHNTPAHLHFCHPLATVTFRQVFYAYGALRRLYIFQKMGTKKEKLAGHNPSLTTQQIPNGAHWFI